MNPRPWMREDPFGSVVVGSLFIGGLVLPGIYGLFAELLLLALATFGVMRLLRRYGRVDGTVVRALIALTATIAALFALSAVGFFMQLLGATIYLVLAWLGVEELVDGQSQEELPDFTPPKPASRSRIGQAPRRVEPDFTPTRSASRSQIGRAFPSVAAGGTCPVQGKVQFANGTEAAAAVQRSLERHRRGTSHYAEPLQSSYRCSSCGGWHVTRQG